MGSADPRAPTRGASSSASTVPTPSAPCPTAFDEWGVDFARLVRLQVPQRRPGRDGIPLLSTGGTSARTRPWPAGSARPRTSSSTCPSTSSRRRTPGAGRSPRRPSSTPRRSSVRWPIFEEAGIDGRPREVAADDPLPHGHGRRRSSRHPPTGSRSARPARTGRRGGHVALVHPEGLRIAEALRGRGVVPDFRPPDIIRVAPVALYNTYAEIWELVHHLRDIIDTSEYERFPAERKAIS